MYLRHFGLAAEPFSIAPDPRFLFMSQRHREALAHLQYGLGAGGGFVVLTGEIGAGKTTVCRCILEHIPAHCNVAYLFNPELTPSELLATVCEEFGVAVPHDGGSEHSTKRHVDALNAHLLRAHAQGQSNVLIIDEAQRLSPVLLEQLRLLTNLETSQRKLLQIALIGQPELRAMLARPELEQLAQRVVARFHLGTLSGSECAQYIAHRLGVAGRAGAIPFDAAALRRVQRLSQGVPRRINLLCDRALLGAYAKGQHMIDAATVRQAARELSGTLPDTQGRWRRASVLTAAGVAAAAAVAALAGAAWLNGHERSVSAAQAAPSPRSASDVRQTAGASTGPAPARPNEAAPSARSDGTVGGVADAVAGADSGAVTRAEAVSMAGAVVSAPDGAAAASPTRVAPAPLTEREFSALLLDAPRDEAQAWRQLATALHLPAPGAQPCAALHAQGLHCTQRRGGVALLRELNRPLLLALYTGPTAPGPARWAVLLGLSESTARLQLKGRDLQVSLPTLAVAWREEFGVIWQPPAGTRLNGKGTAIAVDPQWLLAQLARARGEPALDNERPRRMPSAAQLRAQIRAFQRAHGLELDGLPGALTLMLLQRSADAGLPRLRP